MFFAFFSGYIRQRFPQIIDVDKVFEEEVAQKDRHGQIFKHLFSPLIQLNKTDIKTIVKILKPTMPYLI